MGRKSRITRSVDSPGLGWPSSGAFPEVSLSPPGYSDPERRESPSWLRESARRDRWDIGVGSLPRAIARVPAQIHSRQFRGTRPV